MKKIILSVFFLYFTLSLHCQKIETQTSISSIEIEYKGKKRKAKKVVVSSSFNVAIKDFWEAEQLIENTEKVTKPMVKLNVLSPKVEPYFYQDSTYILRPLSYGFIPMGGKHYIFIEEINHEEYFIQTREYNSIAKVWDHRLAWKKTGPNTLIYTDSVELYAGFLTPVFAWYLTKFYSSRHRNWNKLLNSIDNQ